MHSFETSRDDKRMTDAREIDCLIYNHLDIRPSLVCSLATVAWPPAALSGAPTVAREARRPTRGTPEECADVVLACIYSIQSAVQ